MADLFTEGATVSGTLAFFASFNEIMVADGDPDSPVSLEFTDSGVANLTNQLDIRAATISAASGDDRITTTVGDDLLMGNDGNDTLISAGGNDTLIGGEGDDSLVGGAGDDIFVLTGNAEGHDTFVGGLGADEIRIDSAAPLAVDWLIVGNTSGVEVLNLNGNTLGGTDGADLVDISGISAVLGAGSIDLALGDDTFRGHAGSDTILGGAGNDNLLGNGGDDRLNSGIGDDTVNGGDGNDTLTLSGDDGAGNDVRLGGLGDDTLELGSDLTSLPRLILTAAASIETLASLTGVVATGAAHDLWDLTGISRVSGLTLIDLGAGQDSLAGSLIADTVQGGDGNDSLSGNDGDDLLSGGNDNDSLSGGLGADSLKGEAGNDRIDGGDGPDTMLGGMGDDAYIVGAGDIVRETAGQGTDSITLQGLTSYHLGNNLENVTATGNLAVTLYGNALDNVLIGGAGNDRINGEGGSDTLRGGNGDDIYWVDDALDLVIEAADGGLDTVRTDLASYALAAKLETLIGTRAGSQTLTGNSQNNLIVGAAGSDQLDGVGGSDTLRGGGGNDRYTVDQASDVVQERSAQGRDTVQTSLATYGLGWNVEDLIGTREGRQALTGNRLDNHITGGSGADRLFGMSGKDVLSGGSGADHFVFAGAIGTGEVDRIVDFAHEDTLELENTGRGLFNALGTGALSADAFKVIGPGGAVVDATDRILYDQSTGGLFYDPDGTGAVARVAFAVITPGTALDAADFLII